MTSRATVPPPLKASERRRLRDHVRRCRCPYCNKLHVGILSTRPTVVVGCRACGWQGDESALGEEAY